MGQMTERKPPMFIGGVFVLAGALVLPMTAQAGFFDQLFGASPEPQPSAESAQPRSNSQRRSRKRSHRAVAQSQVSDKPVLQATTDIMHDSTLRRGDAVMTKTGMTIFVGTPDDTHDQDDFAALGDVRRIRRTQRAALVSLDGTQKANSQRDALGMRSKTSEVLASGRSSSGPASIVTSKTVTDQNGKIIRYVGP